jgi:hypothetical protein
LTDKVGAENFFHIVFSALQRDRITLNDISK